jgi:hypothetical protein
MSLPYPGLAFQLKGDGNHLWIVISKEKDGKVLSVNATDSKNAADSPCQIAEGEHEWIKKPSAIFYRKAREFSVTEVEKQISSGTALIRHKDASPELLGKIIEAAFQAEDLTRRFLDYLT